MNSLFPAASRLSCIQPRVIPNTGHTLNSLAVKLVQRTTQPYSISASRAWRKATCLNQCVSRRPSPAVMHLNAHGRGYATRSIITRYEDLPSDYHDEEGLPFRPQGPFSQEETLAIFGKGIDANAANRILRVLHGRRVAGTLDDPDTPFYISVYEQGAQAIAMQWLRDNVPVDEVQSAGLRAEEELAELEDQIVADSTRVGIYRPNSQDFTQEKRGMFSKGKQSVYGSSVLDQLKERSKLKNKMEDEARELLKKSQEMEEEKKREAQAQEVKAIQLSSEVGTVATTGATGTVKLSPAALKKQKTAEWLNYHTERAEISKAQNAPQMTMAQRLVPSWLFVSFIVGVCITLPYLYTPPRNKDRMFPDIPPAAATIGAIMLVNFFIYLAWHYPPLWRYGNKYFATTAGVPTAVSLLGNVFSHQVISHISTNMLVLFVIGTRLHDEIGRANFLSIYFASGVLGSLTSLTSYVLRANFVSMTLGASGAVAGVVGAYLWLRHDERIKMPFSIKDKETGDVKYQPSIPMMVPLFIVLATEIFALSKWNKRLITMDHWAHLGGYATGIGAAEMLMRRARHTKKNEVEGKRKKTFTEKERMSDGRL
ncbi:hypothetical protein BJ878DRAFT_499437 [Calycina marina]|uniref:Peptidase S54 rhomboid domain-containing protein n=1 Tax=Calycina marina TaxID=1763456 RepID=A0A9P8CG56_9HELO|nr:hypothetical protein BJ878DRAFT_499437 [Calycina marina]